MIPHELAVLAEVLGEVKFSVLAEAVEKCGQDLNEVLQILMNYAPETAE